MPRKQYSTNAERQRAYRERDRAKKAEAARQAAASAPLQPAVFTAPLKVLYANGQPLFDVLELDGKGVLRLYNPNGVLAVELEAPSDAGLGGVVCARSPDGKSQADIYADDDGGQVYLTRGERRNLHITVDGSKKTVPAGA